MKPSHSFVDLTYYPVVAALSIFFCGQSTGYVTAQRLGFEKESMI